MLRNILFYFFSFGHTMWLAGSYFSNQGLNFGPSAVKTQSLDQWAARESSRNVLNLYSAQFSPLHQFIKCPQITIALQQCYLKKKFWPMTILDAQTRVCMSFVIDRCESEICSVMSDSLRPHELYSLPSSSAHGVFQARILEQVTVPFSRGSSQPRN